MSATSAPASAPVMHSRPPRRVDAMIWNSGNSSPLAVLPDVLAPDGALRIRDGIGSQERLELALPRRLGLADVQNELYSTGALALDNYLRIYVSDWRTLSGMQADASTGRTGAAEANLARVLWTGILRSIAARPDRIIVRAVAATAGAASGSPQAHKIGFGMLLDWNLEISDYRSPGNVDYTGTIEIAHEAYDTAGIKLGDTITVLEDRVLNPDSATRYNAYGDSPRTVYSLEWTARGVTVTFDARAPDVVNDQLMKLTEVTRDATNGVLISADAVKGAGLQISASPAGQASTVTLTKDDNIATPRSTGVGSIKFADATARDNAGFWTIRVGTSTYYVPVFAAN